MCNAMVVGFVLVSLSSTQAQLELNSDVPQPEAGC